jgi:exonuclease SbcD
VHEPQHVRASPAPARYSGSLLQLDFGEAEQRKSVTLVEVAPGKPARVSERRLTTGRALRKIAGTLDGLRALVPEVGDAWLHVTVHVDAPVPGLVESVRELFPRAVDVVVPRQDVEAADAPSGIVRLDPRAQYVAYYTRKYGAEPPGELLEAFAEIHDVTRSAAP